MICHLDAGDKKLRSVIVLSANTSWYIYNFRLSLIKRLQNEDFDIWVVAPKDDYVPLLQKEECHVLSPYLDNKGTNPFIELKAIRDYRRAYAVISPALVLHYTPKPNIYGSLAARSLGIPHINNIAGLGTAFIGNGLLPRIVRLLYRVSQQKADRIFFQNPDDLEMFTRRKLVPQERVDLLPGSGVDIGKFAPGDRGPQGEVQVRPKIFSKLFSEAENTEGEEVVRFLLIARLIWDKGVGEFAHAARMIKEKHLGTEFQLLGFIDQGNPGAVPEERILSWESEGILTWVGRQNDVRPFISEADCIVLPSYYREGTPRSLLEAASMAKPVITTDAIGCRQAVDDGRTGFLCRSRDAEDLAEKMERIIDMGHRQRREMGRKGREKMVREFDEQIVLGKYVEIVRAIRKG
ncbi:MAG: glycosyltransferase family 4 protein [Thermodesulfobacteriota bacterium]